MSNDPRDHDGSKLRQALLTLGRNAGLRKELMQWLIAQEGKLAVDGAVPVRDLVTGPIIDALHSDDDVYERTLDDGTRFQFLFRTKIARDFLLAKAEQPSHVWEPQTTKLLKYLAAQVKGDVVIGGAYFGDHAILLAKQVQPGGRWVHCFEPNDAQRGMLTRNGELNHLDNLRIHSHGLWNKSSARLKLAGFDSFANAVEAAAGEDGFETVTIDDYLGGVARPLGLLMLDIEGAERHAIEGALKSLERDRPPVVFEVHRDYVDWTHGLLATPICASLRGLGYDLYAVRDLNTNQEMGERPIELIPAATVHLEGPPHGFNMLAVQPGMPLPSPQFRVVEAVSPKLLRHKDPSLHHPLDGMPD